MPVFELVRTNGLSEETTAWFREVLEVIETLDAAAYAAYLSEDVELVMDGGKSRLQGKAAVTAGLSAAWSQLSSLVHNEVNLYGDDRHFAHETVTRTVMYDGPEVFTTTCVWIDRDDAGLIVSIRTY